MFVQVTYGSMGTRGLLGYVLIRALGPALVCPPPAVLDVAEGGVFLVFP